MRPLLIGMGDLVARETHHGSYCINSAGRITSLSLRMLLKAVAPRVSFRQSVTIAARTSAEDHDSGDMACYWLVTTHCCRCVQQKGPCRIQYSPCPLSTKSTTSSAADTPQASSIPYAGPGSYNPHGRISPSIPLNPPMPYLGSCPTAFDRRPRFHTLKPPMGVLKNVRNKILKHRESL